MSNLIKKSGLFSPFLFDDYFSKDFFDWTNKNFTDFGSTLPSVNIKEVDTAYNIEMAVPGFKKEDFKISLDRNVLTISSEKKEEKEDKNEKFTRREYNYQSFSRSFTLPENSNAENISAEYKDGILKVSIPKKEIKPVENTSKFIDVK